MRAFGRLARGIEDELVRGPYLRRSEAERLTVVERYRREITPSKRSTIQASE